MKNDCMKIVLMLVVAVSLMAGTSCTQVESNQLGVRVNNIPIIHKVEKESKFTGYHFYIPKLFTFYKLPRKQQTIELVEQGKIEFKTPGAKIKSTKVVADSKDDQIRQDPEQQLERVKQELRRTDKAQIVIHGRRTGNQSVWVKTSDGNDAWVDVIVAYRIIPDKAYLVVKNVGVGTDDIRQIVASMVRGTIRAWLGELDSKEILRSTDRKMQVEGIKKQNKQGAIDELNQRLGVFGIEIVQLSAPSVTIHPDYEKILSLKRVAEEEKDEYVAYQLKAIQEKETKVNKAKGEADSMIALAKGRKKRILLEADAEFEAKRLEAEATKTKFNELAEGISALTAQLGGPGGDAQVGLAIAEAIQGKKIVIVPGQGTFNMLDLNDLIQSYGAIKAIKGDNPGHNNPGHNNPLPEANPAPPADNTGQ